MIQSMSPTILSLWPIWKYIYQTIWDQLIYIFFYFLETFPTNGAVVLAKRDESLWTEWLPECHKLIRKCLMFHRSMSLIIICWKLKHEVKKEHQIPEMHVHHRKKETRKFYPFLVLTSALRSSGVCSHAISRENILSSSSSQHMCATHFG